MAQGERDPSVSGKTVGAYSVLSEIGRGGMGVVLLAHDPRLERRVALKALAPEFANDPERLARFSREARTLASLNHPNVAQVYGLEEQDGSRYLVMEFVEGRTLGQLLDAGPLAVDEALRLAAQIASGVEAAHEQGVIHRDLKPGNVVVTPEGKAKVLDFGLAREVESRGSTLNLSMSPTAALPHTAPTIEGQILGTVAYMSPEQARGKLLSKRTDVWSFGCVLYEMLTGVAPFAGETASDMIAAILEREPDWSKLPARTPRRIVELLHKCLEKDQSRRLRDIGDARLELEKATADREWSTQSMAAFEGAIQFPRRPKGWLYASALLLVASALAAWSGWALRGSGEGARGGALHARFTRATDDEGLKMYPSLSPDGKTLVYCTTTEGDNLDIYRLRVGGYNPTNLTSNWPEPDYQPAISPDGERIAFRSERDGGGLYVMGATGESPRRITEVGYNPAWSPDGTQLVCAGESIRGAGARLIKSKLWIVDVQSGARRELPVEDGVQPVWSPDGRRIAYWAVVGGGQRDLHTIAVDGGAPVALTSDAATDWSPAWGRDGRHLYFCSDRSGVMGVWRIEVDGATGLALAEPEPVSAGGAGAAAHLAVAAGADRLAYALQLDQAQTWRVAFDPDQMKVVGEPEQVTRGSIDTRSPEISPDGQWLAYTNTSGGQEDIFIIRTDGAQRLRLTDDQFKDRGAQWSPDGKRILFYSDRGGQGYGCWIMNRDGSGLRRISPEGSRWIMPIWTDAGTRVIANNDDRPHYMDPEATPAAQKPIPVLPEGTTGGPLYALGYSPDGAWLSLIDFEGQKIGFFSFARSEVEWSGLPAQQVRFLKRGNRALLSGSDGVFWLDLGSTKVSQIRARDSDDEGSFSMPAAEDWIYFVRRQQESNIWVIDLP
jgi:Tol biopolymer transport system component/predicted Ser/Thr protein kinase